MDKRSGYKYTGISKNNINKNNIDNSPYRYEL